MKLTWLGHSCFVIEGNERVIVDPFITGNPACPVKLEEVEADIVAVTHGHGDHLGDGIALAKRRDIPFVAIHEIAQYAARMGVKAEGINMGGGVVVGDTTITMVPAWHSSGLDETEFAVSTCPAGLVIKSGKTVYHAGDTCLFSDMKLIGELYEPDVALLPIGGRFTMDAHQAAIAAEWIGADITIPMHYNTFDMIRQDPHEFQKLAERRGIRVSVLQPGEEMEI
ncbi:MAG TPA: metal-dependent hydrolase [Thermoplasmatales archaeon]|nr:MAG: metal-dependent hydrolase [Thermoplasmata archaeon]HDN51084.1 metal-dependent hydrolase [Thermoplasmatales archaeon]